MGEVTLKKKHSCGPSFDALVISVSIGIISSTKFEYDMLRIGFICGSMRFFNENLEGRRMLEHGQGNRHSCHPAVRTRAITICIHRLSGSRISRVYPSHYENALVNRGRTTRGEGIIGARITEDTDPGDVAECIQNLKWTGNILLVSNEGVSLVVRGSGGTGRAKVK